MAVNINLTTLGSLQNEPSALAVLNANSAAIEAALQDAVSRSDFSPNTMLNALDMNSNAIVNLPTPISGQSPLRLQDYNTLVSGGTIFVSNTIGVEYVMDGGGAVLSTGQHGFLSIPFSGIIKSVTMLGDLSGSVVVDIWKTPFASYSPPTHPAVGDSITASALPTITSGTHFTDSTLAGWTTAIGAGDVLAFNVNSVANFTRLIVCLTVQKTS